jgi:hypothetical protein
VHLLRAMLGKLNLDLEKVQKDLTAIFEWSNKEPHSVW